MSAVEQLTRRFVNLYGAPETPDPEAFVAEYEKALAGTHPDILQEAADLLVKRHKYRNWPTVGECVEMARDVAERRQRERERLQFGRGPVNPVSTATPEERARVAELVKAATANLSRTARVVTSDWPDTDRDAWEKRLQTSEVAQALAVPR